MNPWLHAPGERTPHYFTVYSTVARTVQVTLRLRAGQWLQHNPGILTRPRAASTFIAYLATTPYPGRPTNYFTYDPLDDVSMDHAKRSAIFNLPKELLKLPVAFPDCRELREQYLPYRAKWIVEHVWPTTYGLFAAETRVVDRLIAFALIDRGQDVTRLLRDLRYHLCHFHKELDLSPYHEEVFERATEALLWTEVRP